MIEQEPQIDLHAACVPSGRDPFHCVTHDSAWDLVPHCQKVLGLPEPEVAPAREWQDEGGSE